MNATSLATAIRHRVESGFDVREEEDSLWVSLPLHDRSGDPMAVRLRDTGSEILIDDEGVIAHLLVSLGDAGSRGYRLLQTTANAYGLEINSDTGLVEMSAVPDDPDVAARAALHFAKVVLSLDTILSEMLQRGQEARSKLGQRVVGTISKELKARKKLRHMERFATVSGSIVDRWKVDYSYKPLAILENELVMIVGVDIGVAEPLSKAEHVLSLAMDVKGAHPDYLLRVAYDGKENGVGKNGARTAVRMMREHGADLLSTFDLGDVGERKKFYEHVDEELAPALKLAM